MKKRLKSAMSLVLVLMLMISVVQINVSAAQTTPMTINVSTKTALPGSSVDVDISLENNPGVASIALDVAYNKSVLTLEKVTYNTLLGGTTQSSPFTDNPARLVWVNPSAEFGEDAVFATLTFKVSASAKGGEKSPITVTYDENDIYNLKEDNLDCTVENGLVTVTDVIPGDINNDKLVNNKDVTRLMQYLAHWDVEVNTLALDTNGDKSVNNKDVTRLMQYLAHWAVELHPKAEDFNDDPGEDCEHQMSRVEQALPTCSKEGHKAYYQCSVCGKKFNDSLGTSPASDSDLIIAKLDHTVVIDPAVAPTPTSAGKTEGSHCSVCGEVIIAQQEIPPIEGKAYSITYHPYADDAYLQRVGVNNPNPNYYETSKGLKLQNVKVDGYIFEGWYDGEGANGELVKTIPAGTTSDIELYAKWTPREYTITFNSPLVPVPSQKYHVNTGATWTNPSLNGYNFIGWCDENDKLVTNLPVGTTGNITLYANWTSKRNQTRPVNRLEDPIIFEDTDKGSILFAYEIGTIENVPLQAISPTYQSVGGMKQTFTTSESVNFTSSEAKNIAKTVSNTATDSKAWTLSENWNDVTSVSETYAQQKGWTKEQAEQYSKTSSNTYSLNSSSGGSQTNTTSNGLSGTLSSSNSATAGGSTTHERETGSEFELGAKESINFDSNNKVGPKVSGGVELNQSYSNYDKNKDTETLNYSNTGTNSASMTGQTATANTGTSTWNTSSGYSASSSVSQTNSVRNVLSEVISESKSYGSSYARGGNKSDTQSYTNTSAESNQYASSIAFSEGTTTTETKTIELGGDNEGYYRFVLASMAHVFAVVGYDVSTSSYYVFNYTVMDDDTYTFIDYSKDTAAFNDNENGVLPFEVPIFVKDYVDARITQTEGLSVSQEGIVTGYNGTDDIVFVPSYYRMNNLDGTYSSIKITGISSSAFAGKNVKAVSLSNFITEIPSGAFKNCSNLEAIICPGVTTIKSRAFEGCTSLREFSVPLCIEELGEKAFNGVEKLSVEASTRNVALGAISSGAKQIILNVSENNNAMADTEFVVPETIDYFELRGNANNFRNIKIKSDAATTVLNGLNITSTNGIPLDISSAKVVLNRVNISSSGFSAIFKNDETDVMLYGSVSMNSTSGKAIVCRNITLSEMDPTISSSLSVVGNIYVCGSIAGQNLLTITNGNIITISDEEFEKYAKGCYQVIFDGKGGTVDTEEKTVYYGSEYGDLPSPSKDYYTFEGWYTEENGGDVVTENTIFNNNTDITLYAHWKKNASSDWVPAIEVPDDAEIVSEKWTYKQKETSTSSSSSKDGWVKYDTQRTSWGSTQGPVYSDPSNGARNVWSESYKIRDNYKTVWHYSRSISGASGWNSWNVSISPNWGYLAYSQDITLDYRLDCTDSNWNGLGARYGKYYYGGFDCPYWFNEWSESVYVNSDYGTRWYYQDPIYTYYYYRYVDKESSSIIEPSTTISGVVHWVKYIPKSSNEFAPQEFDALILHKESQKPIESHDGNIIVGTENPSIGRYQTWHFTRYDDGTYKIASVADGKVIDLESSSTTKGANISVYSDHGENNQRWYLQEYNGGYNLVPKCSPIGVMDLADGKTDDFTNVQFFHFNGTSAQTFAIRIIPDLEQYLSQ